ncbi:NAD-dependent 4,6-dehydratase LegB [Tepidicaulis sp. LMO-SS28]|uniref:NAD-dependent 4,6-dehydratase LegB n=1 Tax=Tepidicaulis sp. LMO-SS28 TaxID=3447455 RepID=UPI003EDEBD17
MTASKTILVTGADGFIGSHLVEDLVRAGHKVRAFVLYNSLGSWGWLDRAAADVKGQFEVIAGDVRDPFMVHEAVKGCSHVAHLAALIAIPYSYVAPSSYVETNITGTLNVMQAARAHGTERVVQTSTSEVYGTAQSVPITEEHPLVGQSPYAASKIGADQMALSYFRSFATPVAVIRPFNTYGPRQSARAVIPSIITQLAAGKRRIELGALSPTRDFCFVADTARGFRAMLDSDKALGEVVNVGTGHEISIGETAHLIAELMGVELEIVTDEQRLRPEASEVERLCASNTKAANLIGWQPEFGGRDGLRRGLQETIEWFSDPANLAAYKHERYNI